MSLRCVLFDEYARAYSRHEAYSEFRMHPHAKFLDCFPRVQRPGECLTCVCACVRAQEDAVSVKEAAVVAHAPVLEGRDEPKVRAH